MPGLAGLERMRVMGAKIFHKLLASDYRVGGRTALFTGNQGSGKTSVLWKVAMAKLALGEIVVVRERDILQSIRFPNWGERVIFYAHKKDELTFVKVYGNMAEEMEIPLIRYSTSRDLLKKLKPGHINAVIEPTTYTFPKWAIKEMRRRLEMEDEERKGFNPEDRKSAYIWAEFLFTAVHRHSALFMTMLFDEMHEIFPQKARGMQWYVNQWSAINFADLRKTNVNFAGVTHNAGDVYYELLRRTNIFGYMMGAKLPSRYGRYSDYLTVPGKIFLVEGGNFGWAYVRPLETLPEKVKIERQL